MWRQLIWHTAQIQRALDAHTAPQAAGWLTWCNGSVWRQTSYRWLLHSCVWEGWKKHYGSASVHLYIYRRHPFMANNRERLDEGLLENFCKPFFIFSKSWTKNFKNGQQGYFNAAAVPLKRSKKIKKPDRVQRKWHEKCTFQFFSFYFSEVEAAEGVDIFFFKKGSQCSHFYA